MNTTILKEFVGANLEQKVEPQTIIDRVKRHLDHTRVSELLELAKFGDKSQVDAIIRVSAKRQLRSR